MHSHVDTIRQIYAAYASRNIEAGLTWFHDDVCFIWNMENSSVPDGGTCHGKAAFVSRLEQLSADWQFARYELVEAIADGDSAASRVLIEVTHRRTGKTTSSELGHFWTFSNGKVTRLIEFFDTASMLELSCSPDRTPARASG